MKTLSLSALALFAFACAPESASDNDTLTQSEMDQVIDTTLDSDLARTADSDALRIHIRKGLIEIQNDMADADLEIVGMVVGMFDNHSGVFKGTGYGEAGQPIYTVNGDFTWASGPEQVRILEGHYTSITEGTAGDGIPEGGQYSGEAQDDAFFAQQIATGHAPLLHEGLWIDAGSKSGEDGMFIGLVGKLD